MSISKFTASLTHEIELELTINDGIFLIKYLLSNSDNDGDNDPVIDLAQVDIAGHDIVDLLSEQTIIYIKMKIREALNDEADFDLIDFMAA